VKGERLKVKGETPDRGVRCKDKGERGQEEGERGEEKNERCEVEGLRRKYQETTMIYSGKDKTLHNDYKIRNCLATLSS